MIPFQLKSPRGEGPLTAATSYALAGPDGERWPILDGIPYLRTGPDAITDDLLDLLDSGNGEEALALALERGGGHDPDPEQIRSMIADRAAFSLREAVVGLGFGVEASDLLYIWSDPDFLASMALLEAHWNAPRCVFEFSCGIGAHLRELAIRGFAVAGSDSSFAKLWLARNWVLRPDAQLLCFDPEGEWPILDSPMDLVMCNGGFHELGPRAEVLACLRKTAGEEGWLVVTHLQGNTDVPAGWTAAAMRSADSGHPELGPEGRDGSVKDDLVDMAGEAPAGSVETTVGAENHATKRAVAPISLTEVEELFPDGLFFADAELITALVEGKAPVPEPPARLWGRGPFSVVFGPGMRPAPRAVTEGVAVPPDGTNLVRNPLYEATQDGIATVAWPSESFRVRVAPRATFPLRSEAPERAVSGPDVAGMARRRELVALPRRW